MVAKYRMLSGHQGRLQRKTVRGRHDNATRTLQLNRGITAQAVRANKTPPKAQQTANLQKEEKIELEENIRLNYLGAVQK